MPRVIANKPKPHRVRRSGRKSNVVDGRILSDREERFINYYISTLDATLAYRRAGYSPHCAPIQAAAMLRRPRLKSEIDRRLRIPREKANVTAERVMQEIAAVGFSNIADFGYVGANGTFVTDLSSLTRDELAAVHEIEYIPGTPEKKNAKGKVIKAAIPPQIKRIRLLDKMAALKELAKITRLTEPEAAAGSNHLHVHLNMTPREAAEAYASSLIVDATAQRVTPKSLPAGSRS